ncbi:MAG: TolC family protein [Gemmatimonadota bacterium]
MVVGLVLLFQLAASADTVRLDAPAALARALEASPVLSAARYRAEAAEDRAAQARAWANPHVSVSGENVGQQRAFTGTTGWQGIEGQAVLTTAVPFGPERAGRIRTARAEGSAGAALADQADLDVRAGILASIGGYLTDRALATSAREERATMDRIADALARQADAGRTSRGDAARADLARGMARTALARRQAQLVARAEELARLLGLDPGTPVAVEVGRCLAPPGAAGEGVAEPPAVRLARARVEAARGGVQLARGLQLPDLEPQVGVRRTGGESGLYLGLSTALPFFDRGTRRLAAARADEDAALAELRAAESMQSAALAATRQRLTLLEDAGRAFDAAWFDQADQAVTAAEARFSVGEGTLLELLDSRRARLQALDDYHAWQSEWWAARVDLARLEGRAPDATLLCTDPFRETSR